jgi:hypothetical protein
VDRIREYEYEVWDYKTGSSYGYKEQDISMDANTSSMLYGLAESILRKRLDKRPGFARLLFPSP